MNTTTTTTDAVFVAGPLDGQWIGLTPGAHKQPLYRSDSGAPLAAQTGDREFVWNPLRGRPARQHYILMTGYAADQYVHSSAFPAWQIASADERRAAVLRYRQPPEPVVLAPRQNRGADPLAARDDGGTAPATGRPGWGLAS